LFEFGCYFVVGLIPFFGCFLVHCLVLYVLLMVDSTDVGVIVVSAAYTTMMQCVRLFAILLCLLYLYEFYGLSLAANGAVSKRAT